MVAPVGGVGVGKAPSGPFMVTRGPAPLDDSPTLPVRGWYCRTRASSRPTVLTPEPGAQKLRPLIRRSCRNSRGIRTALFPFRKPRTNATLVLRGDTQAQRDGVGHRMPFQHRDATWTTQIPQDGPDCRLSLPEKTFRRYFGMITTWYFQSQRTWDKLGHSCRGSSFLPRGAFPEGRASAFPQRLHAGSLEALRVSRPEAVVLAINNKCFRSHIGLGVSCLL